MNVSDPQRNQPNENIEFYASDLSEAMPSHPWELAQSTLNNLLEYSNILDGMSHRAADLLGQESFFKSFTNLIDGLDLFSQGIDGVKRILQTISPGHSAELRKKIDLLELDLLSNLRILLKSQEDKDQALLQDTLRDQLPRTLQEWRDTGIPSLIRARDC